MIIFFYQHWEFTWVKGIFTEELFVLKDEILLTEELFEELTVDGFL